MTVTKTDYTIDDRNRVFKDSVIQAQVVGDLESVLHCIWVLEGKQKHHFYTAIESTVYLNIPVEHYK